MIRVVRTPSGDVRVDVTGKLAGRGAYVCPEPSCIDRAVRDGRLAGALELPLPDGLRAALTEAASRDTTPRAPVVRRVSLQQVLEARRGETGEGGGRRSGRTSDRASLGSETEGSS